MLLDYVAANEIRLEEVAELVEGAPPSAAMRASPSSAARPPSCPASTRRASSTSPEHASAIVDRRDLIDGSTIEAGDAVIGFASAGVHANGFTLVRRVLEDEDYDGDDLLAPTRLYLDDARELRGRAKAFAHVTGGGVLGNLSACSPTGAARRARLGRVGAAARLRVAGTPRRRGRAAPRLQSRHRLVRGRRRAGAG